ncbi:hypothetical protein BT69DRAFT_1281019 [Atractiella rhizophila]|nr:hypothetical protein BT69DRAFT_1281019 [Atractiella rhizophila]
MDDILNDVSAPEDFLPYQPNLTLLEKNLVCQICKDLFSVPVILTTCSHTFCSRCIRDTLSTNGNDSCPTCTTKVAEDKLRPNTVLEEVVSAWKKARPSLLEISHAHAASGTNGKKRKRDSSDDESRPSKKSNAGSNPSPMKTRSQRAGKGKTTEIIVLDDEENSSPIKRSSKKKLKKEDLDWEESEEEKEKFQECPLCSRHFPLTKIEKHAATCLGLEAGTSKSGKTEWGEIFSSKDKKKESKKLHSKAKEYPKKRIPKPMDFPKVTLAKKAINNLETTLSTSGSLEDLKYRLQVWRNLVNSNLDALEQHRRSTDELLADLAEQERRHNAKPMVTPTGDKELAHHGAEHKSEYDRLIREVRERKKKPQVPGSSSTNVDKVAVSSSLNEQDPSSSALPISTSIPSAVVEDFQPEGNNAVDQQQNPQPILKMERVYHSSLPPSSPPQSSQSEDRFRH